MAAFPGWVTTFATDIMLDSGALYVGANGSGVLLGRSLGGLSFDPGHTIESVEFDGARAWVKGLQHITDYKTSIKGKMLQFGAGTIVNVEPGLTSASGSGIVSTYYTPLGASQLFAATSYLANVRLVFRRADLSFLQFRLPVALCTKYNIITKDKKTAEIDVTFEACLDMTVNNPFTGVAATTDDPPYGIEAIYAGSTL